MNQEDVEKGLKTAQPILTYLKVVLDNILKYLVGYILSTTDNKIIRIAFVEKIVDIVEEFKQACWDLANKD